MDYSHFQSRVEADLSIVAWKGAITVNAIGLIKAQYGRIMYNTSSSTLSYKCKSTLDTQDSN